MGSFYLGLLSFLSVLGLTAGVPAPAFGNTDSTPLQETSKIAPGAMTAISHEPDHLAAELTSAPTKSSRILVLGDSISAGYGMDIEDGWVHLMNQTLAERESSWRLINASVSGETTTGGLRRLPDLLSIHQPEIVVLELGGNDGLRGYPTPRIRDNLLAMIDLVNSAGAEPVIVTMRIPPNYGPRYTQAFEGVFADAAAATGTTLVPFIFEALAVSEDLMQSDGIHPTAKAQPLLVQGFLPYLEPLIASAE